ncbi:thiamine phosphate synthase [Candidatus Marinarcus aquaticus]|uniref:Thiamine phosphate synthase n=1 Tax=Candidatus Marinarcus aquaticus TaxID=2044504 RepID=A0A4Q0XRH9_9BACT|nr:thiamine phosphate synthase [Candidatus Marinarcus aquaticus]RXJ57677.1 thiamine phosphate synthase [Candidatus Marinarcus aquaticus]
MSSNFIHYLISDPQYYGSTPKSISQKLNEVFKQHRVDFACFRDKQSSDFEILAQAFIDTCHQNNISKIILNNELGVAIKLKAYGVHLTSQQFHLIPKAKKAGLYTIISCHNEKEIQKAIELNADTITYSPIFDTPNKGAAKGVTHLKAVCKKYDIDVIALGGITNKNHVEMIQQSLAKGFASIRYFV